MMEILFTPLIRLDYVFQLLLAEGLAALHLRRREHFVLRSCLCVLLLTALYALLQFLPDPFPHGTGPGMVFAGWRYLVMLSCSALCQKLCFRERMVSLLFCCSAAQATQHLAHRVRDAVLVLLGSRAGSPALFLAVTLLTLPPVYASMYAVFFRKLKNRSFPNINNARMTFTAIACVILCLWIGVLGTYESPLNALLFDLSMILVCFFLLAYQFDFLSESYQRLEYENLQRAFQEAQRHYELTKENIDLINIKCHDIRQQIRLLGRETRMDEEALKEITDAVSIYDAGINTGNQVLDVILTDKSMYCDRNHIQLGCMIDSSSLGFLQSADMISLFGNLLDNAIEAVSHLSDPRKAIIGLTVRTRGEMLLIHCENFYEGSLTIEGGIPVTTKGDTAFHGYGVKSIRFAAEKYGGTMALLAEDGVFQTNISIPIPAETQISSPVSTDLPEVTCEIINNCRILQARRFPAGFSMQSKQKNDRLLKTHFFSPSGTVGWPQQMKNLMKPYAEEERK